ncbi:uncharacterized protein LOC111099507 [Crassostrea virginica]|uniref:Uncharacterized protein LOC111099507 n=1 Tax=Crassostrea virginica TaxID=6565 RepID=A0A8B8A9G9_CRAVI|nr:uncharacterized protein LOC111099507 [Crassostrea virginica]
MKVQPHFIFVVLLIGTITPVARPQLTSIQALVATSGLATIAANSAGVFDLSFEKLLLVGLATAIVLRPRSDVNPSAYCDAYPTYTYDSTYNLCYRSVKTPLLSAPDAEAACSADGPRAQLIRITDDHIYAFVLLQITLNGFKNIYIQGKRSTPTGPFLYNDGTPVTYFRWDAGKPTDDTYIRTDTNTRLMDDSDGSTLRSYICAVY